MAERFDLDAIAADDALLDRLAAGGEALYDALDAGGDDPAVRMLGELRLAVEVVEDERPGSPDEEFERILAQGAGRGPGADPLARKIATRTLALGVAAVAGLSVSGVAAAVTGDPLSPYEKVIEKVVDGLRPQSTFPIKSVGGVVSSKSASKNAVKEYKKAVEDKGSRTTGTEHDHTDETTTALPDFLGRDDRNRIEPDLPPLVKKEPTFTDDSGRNKVTQPLEKEPADTSTDDTGSEPTEPKVEPTQEPTAEPTTEPSKPVEPITTEPTQEPTQPPTTDPTTPPPTTEPSPTPTPTSSTTTSGETNQPNTGGETSVGTGDNGAGEESTDNGKTDNTDNADSETDSDTAGDSGDGSSQTQSPEEKPVDPPSLPTLPPSIQPSIPSEPDLSDQSQKPSDETSAPGNSDHAKQLARLDRLPAAPLANEFVLRIIATLNGVMASR